MEQEMKNIEDQLLALKDAKTQDPNDEVIQ